MENSVSNKSMEKQAVWDLAVGLQKVDGLTPSSEMLKLIEENVNGEVRRSVIEKRLYEYYGANNRLDNEIFDEKECDLVSLRIVNLLKDLEFSLSSSYLMKIHEYLFKDIYVFNGKIRDVNVRKKEPILNNDTVLHANYYNILMSLEYDISLEKEKDYSKMNIVDVIKSITDFTSRIWQVHPFKEGNTRTTAVFIIKYLRYLGYNIDNSLFKEKSVYFRNALVRSNYYNNDYDVIMDNSYLIRFFENLLLGKNNNLRSRDTIVQELFYKPNQKGKNI